MSASAFFAAAGTLSGVAPLWRSPRTSTTEKPCVSDDAAPCAGHIVPGTLVVIRGGGCAGAVVCAEPCAEITTEEATTAPIAAAARVRLMKSMDVVPFMSLRLKIGIEDPDDTRATRRRELQLTELGDLRAAIPRGRVTCGIAKRRQMPAKADAGRERQGDRGGHRQRLRPERRFGSPLDERREHRAAHGPRVGGRETHLHIPRRQRIGVSQPLP